MSVPGPSGGDDTPRLQAFVNASAQGTTITLPKDVSYRLDGTLVFPNRDLTLVGSGTLLAAHGTGTRNRSQIRCVGGNMRLEGVGIKGANPHGGTGDLAYVAALEAQHCVELVGVQSFTLESSPLSDPYGDCVYLASAPGLNQCVRLLNSPMTRTGRTGVTVNGVKAFLMDNCTVWNIRRSAFDREPTTVTTLTSGVTIRRTHFGTHRLNFLAAVGGVAGAPCDDWTIEDCTSDSPFNIVYWDKGGLRRKNFSFLRSTTSGDGYGTPSGAVIELAHVDGVNMIGNNIPLQQGRTPPMRLAKYTDCTNITEAA